MKKITEKYLPFICVVIPTWNRKDDLLECIRMIYSNKYSNLEIIVIDNASADGTFDAVIENFPEVVIIQLEKNEGAAKASNIGIQYAIKTKADYVLRLDSDIFIDKELILELVSFSEMTNNWGILFPKIFRYDEPETIWYTGAKKHPFLIVSKVENYNVPDGNNFDTSYELDFVPSAAVLIPVDLLIKVGGFDEDFFIYSEDFDLCIKIKEFGKKIFFVPNAKAWHKIGSEKLNDFGLFHFYRGKILLYRKHSQNIHTLFLLIFTIMYIFYRRLFRNSKESIVPSLKGFYSGLTYPISIKQ